MLTRTLTYTQRLLVLSNETFTITLFAGPGFVRLEMLLTRATA